MQKINIISSLSKNAMEYLHWVQILLITNLAVVSIYWYVCSKVILSQIFANKLMRPGFMHQNYVETTVAQVKFCTDNIREYSQDLMDKWKWPILCIYYMTNTCCLKLSPLLLELQSLLLPL